VTDPKGNKISTWNMKILARLKRLTSMNRPPLLYTRMERIHGEEFPVKVYAMASWGEEGEP